MIDQLAEGQYFTKKYLEGGLICSPSLGTIFELFNRPDVDPQSINVNQMGTSDNSAVFQVKQKNPQRYMVSFEFNASQTAAQILPAPGRGRRWVGEYLSIRTESSSGSAYFHDGVSPLKAFNTYFSVQSANASANLFLPASENAPILFTSTQGAKLISIAIGYHVEVIKAQKI